MKTAAVMIERVSLVCPECRNPWVLDHDYADGLPDGIVSATRECPRCGTRYRIPALAFRVGKAPR